MTLIFEEYFEITAANNALPQVRAGHWSNGHFIAHYHLFGVTSCF